jgi:peptidoglycan/xylan/chitin deacetylase (PgdA/CDA1 family)
LSFDDGPHSIPQDDLALLDLLSQEGIRAIFFLVGNKVSQQPEVLRRIHQDNHVIGFHSWNHEDFLFKGYADLAVDIQEFEQLVSQIIGEDYRVEYIRPPYGVWNNFLEADLRAEGYRFGYTSHIPTDTFVQAKDGQQYFQDLLEHVKTQNGGMLILHNGIELWLDPPPESYTDPESSNDRSWIHEELSDFISEVRALGLAFEEP